MGNKIDINSPIIPGKGAAGHSVQAGLLNESICWETYTSDELYLCFREGKLDMVGVMGAYRGSTQQGLGVGSWVSDFELVYGNLIEGPDDALTFERVEDSLWFDVDCTNLNSANWHSQVRLRKVKALYVY